MREQSELRDGCAALLRRLRSDAGLSRSRMALLLGMDQRTLEKYESGISAPRVDEFISYFDQVGADALRYVLDFLYPDTYSSLSPSSPPDDLRGAIVHFILNVASEHTVRELDFLIFGDHGSSITAQAEEWTMINHLPLSMRFAVASLVNSLYTVASNSGLLVSTDHVMPNVGYFRDGLQKGKTAVIGGKSGYTTSVHR